MIYMVEMDFRNTARQEAWEAWYLGHIGRLLTVPGFRASQRFRAVVETASPYLALHEVASAEIFESAAYRAKGGRASTGEWQAQMTNWHRNLLDGLDATPEVPADSHLVVLHEACSLPDRVLRDVAIDWLTGIGLDRTVDQIGLAVVGDPAPFLEPARRDPRVRVFRPLTAKLRAPAAMSAR
jgi:hypothetical protein